MYVFSGYDGLYKNDFHKFSFETSEWSIIKDTNPSAENWPKPRYRTSMIVYKEKIYMFGGHDGTRQLNDFFAFDPKTENWEQITVLDYVPSPRDSHVGVTFGNSLFIFGGSTGATVSNSKNDFFEFNFDENKWYQLQCNNCFIPPSRFCHVGVLHNKKLYIFGGYDGVNRLNDFFEYDFENDSSHSESTLTSDMVNLVNNPTFSDIKFILENERVIYAHRVLLIRIPYFSGMLLSNMKESKESQIKIDNISYYIFLQLIYYIYTDKVEVEGVDGIIELFEVADLYGVERLKAICEKKIFNLLNADNCSQILTSADKRSAHKLREHAISFIIKNFDTVSKTPQFESLMRRDLELGLEILKRR
jgi:leucine-zipper-like transcriptional regulator 1